MWYIGTKEEEGHKHGSAEGSEHCCGRVGGGGVPVESEIDLRILKGLAFFLCIQLSQM